LLLPFLDRFTIAAQYANSVRRNAACCFMATVEADGGDVLGGGMGHRVRVCGRQQGAHL